MKNIIKVIKIKRLILLIISSLFLILYLVLPYSFLAICSGLMENTLNIDDVIFYKKNDGSYKLNKGDIIVFKKRYKPTNKTIKLVHRIEEVYMYKYEIWGYHTKGDAVDSIVKFAVYPEEVVGIYTGKVDRIGYPVVLL